MSVQYNVSIWLNLITAAHMQCLHSLYLKSLHVYAGGIFGQSPFSSRLQLSAWTAWLISVLLPGESTVIPK